MISELDAIIEKLIRLKWQMMDRQIPKRWELSNGSTIEFMPPKEGDDEFKGCGTDHVIYIP
jgi:hypothetical protein